MSWATLDGVSKPVGGMLRSEPMAEDIQARGDHLVSTYRPVVGGVSPGSWMRTQAGAYTKYADPIIPPLDCDVELLIYADIQGTPTGDVRWTVNGNTDSTTWNAAGWLTLGPLTCSGSAEITDIDFFRSAGGGADWAVLHSAIIRPVGDATGLTIDLPEKSLIQSGEPWTADFVRRLGGNATDIAQVRRPALQWFTLYEDRAAAWVQTFSYPFERGRFLDARTHAVDLAASGSNVAVSFNSAATTFVQFISRGAAYHTPTAGLGLGTIKTVTWPMRDFDGFQFIDNTGAPAPVESYSLYESF
jgi:hypothetical protein